MINQRTDEVTQNDNPAGRTRPDPARRKWPMWRSPIDPARQWRRTKGQWTTEWPDGQTDWARMDQSGQLMKSRRTMKDNGWRRIIEGPIIEQWQWKDVMTMTIVNDRRTNQWRQTNGQWPIEPTRQRRQWTDQTMTSKDRQTKTIDQWPINEPKLSQTTQSRSQTKTDN